MHLYYIFNQRFNFAKTLMRIFANNISTPLVLLKNKQICCLKISSLSLLISTLTSLQTFAQLINDEQAPPRVKWQVIETPEFNLLYPELLYNDAQSVASFLRNHVSSVSEQYGIKPRKIDIVIQSANTEGNGYVQLAPRKSEFFITASQDAEPGDWLQMLALHEYRHVVQIDKLTGNIRFPFEELGFAFFGVALPGWFYEGDAVLTETLMSNGGRGRAPSFNRTFRANLLEGNRFSYQKNYFGSFKDRTPGHYELGYFMTTKMYRDFGPAITRQLLSRIASNPLRPYNFSRSLKKITGFNTRDWHEATTEELTKIWKADYDPNPVPGHERIAVEPSRFPQQFAHPQPDEAGRTLALWIRPQGTPSIARIEADGHITELVKTGRQATPHFAHSAGILTWDEVQSDPRFKLRNFSVVHRYDIAKKEHRQLTRKSRFFGPVLSADGRQIAVVEIDLSNRKSLVVLDAFDGSEQIRIASPGNDMLASLSPQFEGKILAINRNAEGAGMVEFNLTERSVRPILAPLPQELESPQYSGSDIIFKAHFSGVDNLYFLQPQNGEIRELSRVPYGAYDPFVDRKNRKLYFMNDEGRDLDVRIMPLDQAESRLVWDGGTEKTAYFEPLRGMIGQAPIIDSSQIERFPVKPYNRFSQLLNFHSLSINNGDFSTLDDYKPGLFLLSNNLMNTLAARAGITYDYDIRALDYHASLEYKRYYPVFSLAYDNLERFSNIRHPRNSQWYGVRWREHETRFQVDLPVSFNRLDWNYSANLRVATSYTRRYNINEAAIAPFMIREIRLPMTYQLRLGRNARYSAHDLAPRWGQNFSLTLRHLPFSDTEGMRFGLQSVFYFPGLLANHSTQLRYNVQHREGLYRNDNVIPMVSGYDQLSPTRPKSTFFMNYQLPLAYPDFEIGPLAYVKRLKANFGADFEDPGIQQNFTPRTYSFELTADLNVLRFLLPEVEIGIKTIYVNEQQPERFLFQYSLQYSY